ncbi:nucleolar transcription factor 1-B-like [Sabethes cyaneus]|uniref:nucleolar transcription factor 1-B-like n=1 Tax=Sabethes cyaneus TaxID=53552 RepID=UPI00237D3B0F|nr:nucleolar transcription factor 1-B-like [Sabethes cyaneus]
MRQRSMSVFVPKDDNRFSKRFEGVVSDNEEQSDLESDNESKGDTKPDFRTGWTKTDYDDLLEKLKNLLPKKDTKKFTSRLQAIDWKEIEVRHHSPEDIKQTVDAVLAKIRRFRTLGEMLADAPDIINKLLSKEKPKPPASAYTLFMKENFPRWKEANLDMKDVFKVASKEFRDMSLKKRQKYEEASNRLKQEYKTNMEKYYAENPDMVSQKAKRTRTSNKQLTKTPFNLFLSSRRETEDITLAEARKEWEDLPHKKKLKYVQQSFAAQSTGKWLNKKEQEMLDRFNGKPDFVGRNAFEFYVRKHRSQFDASTMGGKIVQQKIREEYHKLSPRDILDLKDEYALARDQYITQYRAFIANLPKDKQEAELEHLRSLTDKSSKPKQKVKDEVTKSKEELYPGSNEEDPPVAESTTIKKPTKSKKQKPTDLPVKLEPVREKSPSKRPKQSSPLPSSPKVVEADASSSSNAKTKKPADKKKKNVEDSSSDTLAAVTTSSSNNGETKKAQATKRSSNETAMSPVEKKSRKQTIKEETKDPPKEPEKPPATPEEFYRQRIYKGKVGKYKESYANLSAARKREIADLLKQAQTRYIVDFENFLKSLPRDEIRRYIQKAKTQKKETADDDSDEDETDEEDDAEDNDSSSGSEEESD